MTTNKALHADGAVSAVSAIVRRGGSYLLVRRANPPAKDMFAFPGGRVDAGESLAEAVLRELREETGLDGRSPVFHSQHDLTRDRAGRSPGARFLLNTYLVEADPALPAIAGDDAAEAGWFTAGDAFALPLPDSVRQCIEELERHVPD